MWAETRDLEQEDTVVFEEVIYLPEEGLVAPNADVLRSL